MLRLSRTSLWTQVESEVRNKVSEDIAEDKNPGPNESRLFLNRLQDTEQCGEFCRCFLLCSSSKLHSQDSGIRVSSGDPAPLTVGGDVA